MNSADYLSISRPGRTLRAKRVGSGPPVVLEIGGGTGGVDRWGSVEGSLAERATVITYDRVGLGGSDPLGKKPDLQIWLEDLRAVIEQAAGGRAVLVGWSLGGVTTVGAAYLYPSLVEGLVLIDPATDEDYDSFVIRALGRVLAPVQMGLIKGAARSGLLRTKRGQRLLTRMIRSMVGPTPDPTIERMLLELMSSITMWSDTGMEARALMTAARELRQIRRTQDAPQVPVAVITGTRRPAMAETIRKKHESLISRLKAEHVIAEGCGHHIPYERPEIIVSTVFDLLNKQKTGQPEVKD